MYLNINLSVVYGVLLVILSCPVKKKFTQKQLWRGKGWRKDTTSGVEGEACLWGRGFTLRQWGPDPVPPSAIEICRRQRLTSPKAPFLPLHTK